MKRFGKTGIAFLLMTLMIAAFAVNVSAATISDGIKAEIEVISQSGDKVSVNAVVKNANYYAIDGINCKLSVSDNAVLSGEDVKTDLTLLAEQSESLTAEIGLKNVPTTKPSEAQSTETPSQIGGSDDGDPSQSSEQPKGSTTITSGESSDKSVVKTGADGAAMPIIAIVLVAFSFVICVAFRKKNKRLMSLMLCLCLTLSAGSFAVIGVDAAEDIKVITDKAVVTINGADVTVTFTVEYPEQVEIHDNSLEDLKTLNGASIDVIYNDNGEISFLNGKYTDYKVTNLETAMSSLQAVETILNVKENDVSLIPIDMKISDNGDTYYTFNQNVGAVMLSSSYITVGADKDGNTLCLSSSIQPKAGYVPLEGNMITAEQAEAIVDGIFGDMLIKIDMEPILDYEPDSSKLCWVVFRKNPETAEPDSEKMQYVKLYISADSGQLSNLKYVSDISEYETDDGVYNNDTYFQKETEMMTFTDYFGNEVQLPVVDKGDGTYYFCDNERRIVCADSEKTEEVKYIEPKFYLFSSADEVPPVYVSVFANMRKIYDKYAEVGVKSIDGIGMPLMICLGYKEYGKEIENACYAGNHYGWGRFKFSNTYVSTPLDVAAHEYTHGIKHCLTGDAAYQNITGAIEESYADILGNLTEMLIDPENSDTETWQICESSGKPVRSMGNPHLYAQPEYVGDAFFMMECDPANEINDNGGVHLNNSILSKICFDMYKSGMSMKDLRDLWFDTFYVFNPNADFDDVLGYLKFTAVRDGKSEYIDLIQRLFEKANAINANTKSWEGYETPEGYAKLTVNGHDFPEGLDWSVGIKYGNKTTFAFRDSQGITSAIIDKENVLMVIRYHDDMNAPIKKFYYKPKNDEGYNLCIDKDEVVIDFSYNDLIPYA